LPPLLPAGEGGGEGARVSLDDDFYERLLHAHRDLTPAQSHALNARLVLLLAHHIGDPTILRDALAAARDPSP
jgi:hypothetical protein